MMEILFTKFKSSIIYEKLETINNNIYLKAKPIYESYKYLIFSDLYCLLYDKIHRQQLYESIIKLTIYESKDIKDKEIKEKLVKFEDNPTVSKDLVFEELYYLSFYDNIMYERIIGLTSIIISGLNLYFMKSYLKKNLYTKFFIFIDNNRFFANYLMAIENSLNRLYMTILVVTSLFGTFMLGKSYFKHNFFILPSEQILRKKYKRDLLIYNNLKFSFI